MKRKHWLALGALLLVGGGVAAYVLTRRSPVPSPPTGPAWFEDATEQWGLVFNHDAGNKLDDYWMPRINGSGVAIFDCDGDDKLDVYFLNFGGPDSKSVNRLFRNLGGGKFLDITEGSGLGIPGHNAGVIVGDVDNDGRPDVVVTQYNGVKLFRNLGGGKFADVTPDSGLKNPLWAASANLFDYDRDGWLDLVIVNYVDYNPSLNCPDPVGRKEYCGPHVFPHTVSKLFHNLGPKNGQPRFEDVTVKAGLAAAPGPGLGVYCADFDGDGWQDIFIANDLKANHLWMNQRNGTFKEEAFTRGIALDGMGQAQSGMGIAAGDADNDGLFDIFVTHLSSEKHTLWGQGPKRGRFTDRTARAGLLGSGWRGTGWGTVFCDFDRDGWLDIAVANGAASRSTEDAEPSLGEHFSRYGQRNQVFKNDGSGSFEDISPLNPTMCGRRNTGRGLAVGDLDGDGASDVIITNIAQRAQVFRNIANGEGRGLRVRALDPRLSRDAFGAEITLATGGTKQLRIVNPGDSFLSSSDPAVYFGLGEKSGYDSIMVSWPDGLREIFPGGDAGGTRVLKRGSGRSQIP
ncbi:MAG: CRTAC1 family protein [Gemmataceae bacterium]